MGDEHEEEVENADDGGGDGDAGSAAEQCSDHAAGESMEEAGRVGEAKAVLLLERREFGQGLLLLVVVLLLFLLLVRIPPRCCSSV